MEKQIQSNLQMSLSQDEFQKTANKVSFVSIIGNIALSFFKLIAGIFAHSSAMISDAIHSASDVFSSIVVLIGIHYSTREADKEHPYGHERLECVAAIILSMVLVLTGFFIGKDAFFIIIKKQYQNLAMPGTLALIAAVVSILSKEAMFWYTKYHAKRIDSSALLADAWHHRSDALSSIGAFIGIAGSRLGFPISDPLASLIICAFILKAAYEIFTDAINKMVDHSCDEQFEQQLYDFVSKESGVLSIDLLQTRVFGNKIYIDLEIGANKNSTLLEAHNIAERIHSDIEKHFSKVKHIMVHVNPR